MDSNIDLFRVFVDAYMLVVKAFLASQSESERATLTSASYIIYNLAIKYKD